MLQRICLERVCCKQKSHSPFSGRYDMENPTKCCLKLPPNVNLMNQTKTCWMFDFSCAHKVSDEQSEPHENPKHPL